MRQRILALAAMFAALVAMFGGWACSGGDDDRSPTSTPENTATAEASATPDPVGDPVASGDRMLEHVRALSVDIGPRVAGTDAETLATDYLSGVLESYGYEVEIQQFPFDTEAYLPAVVEADGDPLNALKISGSADGTVSGTLVDGGFGRPEELPAGSAPGSIALIERGDLTFGEKVANARSAGAVGVIIFNNEDGEFVGDGDANMGIPAVSMTRADGLMLRDRTAAGQVAATITVYPANGTATNIIARPPGVTQCTTVTGGHADSVSVSPGADDNASGTAGVLEVARLAMADGLTGANCFVLFGAEEFGLYGSRYYVDTLSDADVAAMRAMINLDVIGLPDEITLIGDDDLAEVARGHAQALGVDAASGTIPGGLGSDHASFQDAGVPVIFLYRHDALFHTPQDAIDRIDAEALEQAVMVAYATLREIAGAP